MTRTTFWERYPRLLPATIIIIYYIAGYFILGHISEGWTTYQPKISLDSLFPLSTSWVVIYGFIYIFALIPIPVITDPAFFRRIVYAYVILLTISYLVYFFYPTSFARELTALHSSHFFDWALGVIWYLDPPRNCFPSLHVSTAFLSAFAVVKLDKKLGWTSIFMAILIAISTLFTRQHYLLDIVGGFGIALLAALFFIFPYPSEKIEEKTKKEALKRSLYILLGYSLLFVGFYIAFSLGIKLPTHIH